MHIFTNYLRTYLRPIAILTLALFVAGGTLLLSAPANSQGSPGQCCTNFCGMEPPCGGDIIFTCEDFGQVGVWPNCVTPPPADCGIGMPSGLCIPDFDPTCYGGGVWPFCDEPTCADLGLSGAYPDCYVPQPPTCADSGQLGTYPNCYTPQPPTCADSGLLGTYPNCYAPPQPTCADFGQLGTYPNCYAPPNPTCADIGLLGSWPNCYAPPNPTCADSGLLGTYPNCYAPPNPTCADSGQLGTYPNCYDGPGTGDPAPTATLTANPNPASGNTALTWTSTNTTSCTGVGTSFSTGGARNGTDPTVTPGFTYQVQCTGPGGNVTAQVVAGLIGGSCANTGPLTITATPSRIQSGENVTLSWSAGNIASASCTVTNLATGASLDSANAASCAVGNETTPVTNVQAQTTYRLTCGTLTKDVTVNVVPRYEEF
jgi:hypothetical protein